MRIASNKVKDILRFFREELGSLYDAGELDTIFRYCLEEFAPAKTSLSLQPDATVSESELLKFNLAVKELKNNKPLQYVLGKADFYGLKFLVDSNVLIPRPETEELVHLILNDLRSSGNASAVRILDIGTGSGCIPVTLKTHLPGAEVLATDISEKALGIASENAAMNNADVTFLQHDILSGLPLFKAENTFDIIVSNPPYIKHSEMQLMEKNVLDHEPHLALFVENDDALLFYRKIAEHAFKLLRAGGQIYFEINALLAEETRELLLSKGFKNVVVIKDINDKNRILRGML